MARPFRRWLGASGVLSLLILIAICATCSAADDVPPEDKPAETAAELAAYKQKEKDRMFFLPSNAKIPEPGNGTSRKTNPLGAVKQIIFVRHGEHAYLNDTDTPCMSSSGMARAIMLTRYLTKPDAPKGVLPPTLVYAMNGNMKEDDPRTVRPINTAIPYVVSRRIPRDRFVTKFGQRTPADVAASMLSEGKGQVILNIWLHWEVPPMINFMGVPVTGWNNENLDEETQATYKPVIVMTPGEKGVHTQLFHTPPIDEDTFLPELPWKGLDTVHWESHTSWEDVARQQGSIERVIFPAAAAGGATGSKAEGRAAANATDAAAAAAAAKEEEDEEAAKKRAKRKQDED